MDIPLIICSMNKKKPALVVASGLFISSRYSCGINYKTERLGAGAKNGERDRHEVVIMLLFIWGMNKKQPTCEY